MRVKGLRGRAWVECVFPMGLGDLGACDLLQGAFAPLPGPMKMGSLDTIGKIRVDPQRIKRPVISWCA